MPSSKQPEVPVRHSDMDCDTIDQAQRPSAKVMKPERSDSVPQQASTQPGDGSEIHTERQPGPNVTEVPSKRSPKSPKVPFKEQVVGVAKKTRGTILGKPELKHEGEQILEGKTSAFAEEPQSI